VRHNKHMAQHTNSLVTKLLSQHTVTIRTKAVQLLQPRGHCSKQKKMTVLVDRLPQPNVCGGTHRADLLSNVA